MGHSLDGERLVAPGGFAPMILDTVTCPGTRSLVARSEPLADVRRYLVMVIRQWAEEPQDPSKGFRLARKIMKSDQWPSLRDQLADTPSVNLDHAMQLLWAYNLPASWSTARWLHNWRAYPHEKGWAHPKRGPALPHDEHDHFGPWPAAGALVTSFCIRAAAPTAPWSSGEVLFQVSGSGTWATMDVFKAIEATQRNHTQFWQKVTKYAALQNRKNPGRPQGELAQDAALFLNDELSANDLWTRHLGRQAYELVRGRNWNLTEPARLWEHDAVRQAVARAARAQALSKTARLQAFAALRKVALPGG